MNPEMRVRLNDPTTTVALDGLREIVRRRYPEATFEVGLGEDPEGVYLTAVVDAEDTTDVLDAVADRLFELQVEQELPLYLVAVRPVERMLQDARSRAIRGVGR